MHFSKESFNPEWSFNGDAVGNVSAFSVDTEKKNGFVGYYISANADKDFNPEAAVKFRFECSSKRFMAIYSHSTYWVQPAFGTSPSQIPRKTCALVLENEDGTYTYVMTAIGKEYKTYVSGAGDCIEIMMYSQYPDSKIDRELSFITATGNSITELVKRGAEAMCAFVNNGLKVRADKTMPEILEYFGWCSWDAFGIRVDHDGLVEKANEFKSKGIPVKYAIIDDMWADVPNLKNIPLDATFSDMVKGMHASPMRRFEADTERFPGGLSATVSALKGAGIDKVGLWFPTTGYWYGLIEGEEAYCEQKENVKAAAGGRIIAIPEKEPAERYFDLFCKKAKDFGCDFVKIDNQSCHGFYNGMYPIGKSSAAMQEAIDKAAFKHFGGALINCMGMPVECMLNRPMSAVSRCSDDFMPESKSWFAKNILECAYNGLLQGQFYINDWDMWWTDDAQAEKNALCHAISGGPIYVSDKLGRTKPGVLKPLMFEDGRILRLSDSGAPTEDCIMQDPRTTGKPFKIKNRFDGGAAIAVFNVSAENTSVKGSVSCVDAGLDKKKTYMYYEYFSGDFGYVNGDEEINVVLDDNDKYMYFTFIEKSNKLPLFLGRIDKFNPRLAVVNQTGDTVELYEGGDFAFISDEDYAVFDERGNEIECERFGIFVSGTVAKENRILKFVKYDI